MKRKTIVIIPARGGSKRIPRKNIREFCGRPIISYAIENALKTEGIDEVMVSTDDVEIAEIAKKYGAKVPFLRDPNKADDFTTTAEVIKSVLAQYKNEFDEEYEQIICLYPTTPLLDNGVIGKVLAELEKEEVDSAITVVPFSYPPQRGMVIREGYIDLINRDQYGMRTQDAEKIYHDCGQLYAFKSYVPDKFGKMSGGNCKAIVLNEMETQDIDNEIDWKLAELKYQLIKEQKIVR